MPGIGQPDVEPLSGGAAAQPLVTPVQPVLTPNAVQQLVDAVHNGAINTIDIANRIGSVAQAEKKANLEKLGEYVSPEAIQSRMSQINAQGQQAQLAGAQAQAQTGLVPQQTEVSQRQLAAQSSAAIFGAGGLDTFQKTAKWYGDSPQNYRKPDGTFDTDAMSQAGDERANDLGIAQNWLQQLAPEGQRVIKKGDSEFTQDLNHWKVNVTPPDPESGYKGSNAYWAYVKQLQAYLPAGHPARGQYIMTPVGGDDSVPGRPKGSPSGPHGMVPSIGHINETDTQPNINTIPTTPPPSGPIVTPGGAPTPPEVNVSPQVSARPQPDIQAAGDESPGILTKAGQTPTEATAALEAKPDVKAFYTSLPVYTGFADASRQSIQQPSSVSDLALAESYSKLFDPQSTLREFKFEALQKAIPWLDKFADAPGIIARTHMFPPDVRKAIARSGLDVINSREKALVPRFEEARAEGARLDSAQKQILAGVPFSTRAGLDQLLPAAGTAPGASPPAGTSRTVTLSSGRDVQVNY